MWDVSENCMTQTHKSDIDLTKTTSDRQRVIFKLAILSLLTTIGWQGQKAQEQTNILGVLRAEKENSSFIPEFNTTSGPRSLS